MLKLDTLKQIFPKTTFTNLHKICKIKFIFMIAQVSES